MNALIDNSKLVIIWSFQKELQFLVDDLFVDIVKKYQGMSLGLNYDVLIVSIIK